MDRSHLQRISRIYLKAYSSDASKKASYNISKDDIYLETAEYETMEISTQITSSSDKDAPFVWSATGTLSTIVNNFGKDKNLFYVAITRAQHELIIFDHLDK
jgi:hypothetical protein